MSRLHPSCRKTSSASLLISACIAGCGGAEDLQILEGLLNLDSLHETALIVQARDDRGELRAASPTDADGRFVLFVPPATLTVTASGRRVHALGTLQICTVGPPVSMEVSPAPSGLSDGCLAARGELSDCRRTVEPACDILETAVQACRAGDRIGECLEEREALGACQAVSGDCDPELDALNQCLQSACAERLFRFIDSGCLEGCGAQEEEVIAACTEPRLGTETVMEVGCSSSR